MLIPVLPLGSGLPEVSLLTSLCQSAPMGKQRGGLKALLGS